MMNAAASTCEKPSGSGMHRAAGAMVWVPKPPVPDRQATFWPTLRWVTPSPTAATTPAYSEPGTKGRGGFIWYLFCTISRSGKFRLAALIWISTSPALGVDGCPTYNPLQALPQPMKILISNDDGYQAPGIVALHDALKTLDGVEV